ncbi:hypothetical protein [Alphabaculovirus altersperidaniae]|uniref:Uncharacterized protein n=1 Tax=Spodoptera eridania nucleopolyhedrovirus TaxID=2315721 RepID=A0ABX6TQ82_9ABAC|nr:hypothetical protein QKS47_gp119 [Spodoptera eridania nucleopolyhedrovirus]QNV47901.1 hypothetical protein [Spodoptera eridania nucleopolyhedrovirus]
MNRRHLVGSRPFGKTYKTFFERLHLFNEFQQLLQYIFLRLHKYMMIVLYLTITRINGVDYKKKHKMRTIRRYRPKSLKRPIAIAKRIVF